MAQLIGLSVAILITLGLLPAAASAADYAGPLIDAHAHVPNATAIDAYVAAMKREPGKDIWLFGGGDLFRQLLSANLVDTIELALMPILIGEGIRVLPAGPDSPKLELTSSKPLPSGILMLTYRVPEQKAETS